MKGDNSHELDPATCQHNLQDFSMVAFLAFATVLWAGTVILPCIYANQARGKETHSDQEHSSSRKQVGVQPKHLEVAL